MIPRVAILGTAIAELATGDLPYGVFCLGALVLTLVPALHARQLDAGIPLPIELALLWLMIADMTLGNALGLYGLTWYDKAVHLSSSVLIGTIGFLAIYVLHMTGDRKFHPWLDGVAILLVTLGLGAIWEMSEFLVDQLFSRRTQGSPTMGPLTDTMADLFLDAVGGLIAAVFGALFLRRSKRRRGLLDRRIARVLREHAAPA
jgi:hypothetical protein